MRTALLIKLSIRATSFALHVRRATSVGGRLRCTWLQPISLWRAAVAPRTPRSSAGITLRFTCLASVAARQLKQRAWPPGGPSTQCDLCAILPVRGAAVRPHNGPYCGVRAAPTRIQSHLVQREWVQARGERGACARAPSLPPLFEHRPTGPTLPQCSSYRTAHRSLLLRRRSICT